jgi:glucokinase
MTTYISMDIGGTNIRAARMQADGTFEARSRHPTAGQADEVTAKIHKAIEEVWPDSGEVKAIAIAAPGPLDPFTGIVYRAPNVPGWVNYPLQEKVQSKFNIPVVIGNDANMAAMGEWKYGAGRGHNDVLYLTISTGIGGAAICGGRLIVGAHGLATELGHVTVHPDGPVCGCGQRGHLEAMASGPAIANTAKVRLKNNLNSKIWELVEGDVTLVTARHVGDAAKAGDDFAIGLLEEAGVYIGQTIADYLHIFNPSIVILGGGVSINVGDLLLTPIRASMKTRLMEDIYLCDVVLAELGDDVGLLGTLALAVETFPQ